MPTVGSLAYQIIADHTDFKAGIVATRSELKTLRSAFLDTQAPVDRFSQSIQHLENLMAKFPSRAGELRKSIHAIKREMDSARFARGAANEAGFLSDLDAGLARNRARDAAFRGAQIPSELGGGGKSGLLLLKQNAEAANRAVSALNGGSIIPLLGSLASLGPAAVIGIAVAGLGVLAYKTLAAADAARKHREEFFKELDAFSEAGGDTSFASHIERVESLSTKWAKAREAADMYLASIGEQAIRTGEGSGAAAAGAAGGLFGGRLGTMASLAFDAMTLEQRQFKAVEERLGVEKKALEERKQLEEKHDRERREWAHKQADENERRADTIRARERKEGEETLRRVREAEERDRKIKESTRTPAEIIRRDLKELGLSGVDPATRMRALRNLEERAMEFGGAGGTPRLQSQSAIRAGSVEALRANFPGGNSPDEKQLAEQKKTAKNTAEAKTVLVEIRDAIKSQAVGVMP